MGGGLLDGLILDLAHQVSDKVAVVLNFLEIGLGLFGVGHDFFESDLEGGLGLHCGGGRVVCVVCFCL